MTSSAVADCVRIDKLVLVLESVVRVVVGRKLELSDLPLEENRSNSSTTARTSISAPFARMKYLSCTRRADATDLLVFE